jgi:hypothetical protein
MRRAGLVWAGLLFLALAGCGTDQLWRLQSDDEDKEKEKPRPAEAQTIGEVTSVWGTQPVRLWGVGVVDGLPGTGSEPEPGEMRRAVLHDLKQRGVEDPAAFLATGTRAVVIVTAVLPPGIRKGEPIDVEVELPARDRATSLRGGYLLECELHEYADSHELRGQQGPHGPVKGRALARVEGRLIVGLAETNDKDRLRRGRIWGGGKAMIDRNFALLLKKDARDGRRAKAIADRINERFYGPFRGTVRGMAEAKNDTMITLKIPPQYALNWPRYLRVVRQIPLHPAPGGQDRAKAAEQLLDPAQTVVAALKLEAIGQPAIDDLKRALTHVQPGLTRPHPLVRFCAAEALAYLGDPACAPHLAALVEEEPRLRAYGLTALASLNESICHLKLRELLSSPSAETRYGAFRALWTLDGRDAALNEEELGRNFFLHRVAPESPPLVHLTMTRRAEVVLFGREPMLVPPFNLQAGPEFLVTARVGEEHCIVSRFSPHHGVRRETCSLRLYDVLHQLGALGATYPDVVELLQQASRFRNLDCPLRVDALPQATSVYELARAGARDRIAPADPADAEAGGIADLGMVPNLFAGPR